MAAKFSWKKSFFWGKIVFHKFFWTISFNSILFGQKLFWTKKFIGPHLFDKIFFEPTFVLGQFFFTNIFGHKFFFDWTFFGSKFFWTFLKLNLFWTNSFLTNFFDQIFLHFFLQNILWQEFFLQNVFWTKILFLQKKIQIELFCSKNSLRPRSLPSSVQVDSGICNWTEMALQSLVNRAKLSQPRISKQVLCQFYKGFKIFLIFIIKNFFSYFHLVYCTFPLLINFQNKCVVVTFLCVPFVSCFVCEFC